MYKSLADPRTLLSLTMSNVHLNTQHMFVVFCVYLSSYCVYVKYSFSVDGISRLRSPDRWASGFAGNLQQCTLWSVLMCMCIIYYYVSLLEINLLPLLLTDLYVHLQIWYTAYKVYDCFFMFFFQSLHNSWLVFHSRTGKCHHWKEDFVKPFHNRHEKSI